MNISVYYTKHFDISLTPLWESTIIIRYISPDLDRNQKFLLPLDIDVIKTRRQNRGPKIKSEFNPKFETIKISLYPRSLSCKYKYMYIIEYNGTDISVSE